jgi:hypothetical protein
MLNLILSAYSIKNYIETRKYLNITSPNAIGVAFNWCNSVEGINYWTAIDRKWQIKYAFLLSGDIIKPYIPDPPNED